MRKDFTQGGNILIVEDDQTIQNLLSIVLKREKHHVFTAKSVEEALEIIENEDIDIIIQELNIQGGGLTLLHYLQKLTSSIISIIVTG